MIKHSLLVSILAAGAIAACGDNSNMNGGDDSPLPDAPAVDSPTGGETIRVTDDITTDTTWTKNNVYVIGRLKQVFVQAPATLTIEPGTLIKGEQGSVLVITRGAKIHAEGTAAEPITFTSSQAAGQRTAGWWGGLLVLGKAPINVNKMAATPSDEATYEAFTASTPDGKFGGTDPADNSGVLKYVRIQFAGFNFVADREFNNLTLCGVGSGTTVDYIQVHGGSDDGVEFFGGTVNVKHLVSSQNQDDGFDTDNGWVGNAQFIVVQNVSHPATLPEASNGYESDNHGDATQWGVTAPVTTPTIYNVTLIGDHEFASSNFAAIFRRGTAGHYYNHIWYKFKQGIEFRDAATQLNLDVRNGETTPRLTIKNSILFGNGADASNMPPVQTGTGVVDIVEANYLNNTNQIQVNVDPGFSDAATSKTAPNFKPSAPLTTGAATPGGNAFFDATATFIGAIGADDWTAGWTEYPQN